MDEVSDTTVEDVEQTCWLWVSFLVTFSLASFAYRIFGPELIVEETPKENLNIEELPVKHSEPDEQILNKSMESEGHQSRESSSGPEFEIINQSDVPNMLDIELKEDTQTESPKEEVRNDAVATDQTPTSEIKEEEDSSNEKSEEIIIETAIKDVVYPNKNEDDENSLERYEDELMQGQLNEKITLKNDEEPELTVDKKNDIEDESESHANEPAVFQESLYDTAFEEPTTEEAAYKKVIEMTTEQEQLIDIVDEKTSPEVEVKLQTDAAPDVAIEEADDGTPEDVVIVPEVNDNVDEPTKNEPESSTLPSTDMEEVENGNDGNEKSDVDEQIQQVAQEIVEAAISKEVDQTKMDIVINEDDEISDELQLTEADMIEEKKVRSAQLEEIEKVMKEAGMGDVNPSEQSSMYF